MIKNTLFPFFLLLVITLFLGSCEEVIYTPKPRAFPKIEFPQGGDYQQFSQEFCNFTFTYPEYAKVVKDKTFFENTPPNACWFDIQVEELASKIHFTYYPINKVDDFQQLREDAFRLAQEHNKKANYIDELPIQKEKVSGFVFDIEGEVASPFQFYLTDSTQHFLRGALYFDAQARPDSLAPAYDFMKKEILKMIDTFEWQ